MDFWCLEFPTMSRRARRCITARFVPGDREARQSAKPAGDWAGDWRNGCRYSSAGGSNTIHGGPPTKDLRMIKPENTNRPGWEKRKIKNGRGGEIRTHDLLYPKQARYQATLRPDTGQEHEKLPVTGRDCNTKFHGAGPLKWRRNTPALDLGIPRGNNS